MGEAQGIPLNDVERLKNGLYDIRDTSTDGHSRTLAASLLTLLNAQLASESSTADPWAPAPYDALPVKEGEPTDE